MSSAYFIILDNPHPGFDPSVNGKALARESAALDRTAAVLGLPPIESFVSNSPEEARAMLEELGGDPEGVEFPAEQWFAAEEGLAWVAAVEEHVRVEPDAVENAGEVLADLKEYEAVLKKAKAIGARWRLDVDY